MIAPDGTPVFSHPLRHQALAACGGTDLLPFEVAHPCWPTDARPWGGTPMCYLNGGPGRIAAYEVAAGIDSTGLDYFLSRAMRAELPHVDAVQAYLSGYRAVTDPGWDDPAEAVTAWYHEGILYDDADVLVMPRRYGGLCLPVNEAAGAGLALVMSDVAPNHRWPIDAVQIESTTRLAVPAGEISTASVHVGALTHALTRMATDDALRHQRQREARQWAQQMAWSEHADEIREAMA